MASPARIFRYNHHVYADVDPGFSPEDVRRALVQHFPKLATARIEEKVLEDGAVEVRFVEDVGRKG